MKKESWWEWFDPHYLSVIAIVVLLIVIGASGKKFDSANGSDRILVSIWSHFGNNGLAISIALASLVIIFLIYYINKNAPKQKK